MTPGQERAAITVAGVVSTGLAAVASGRVWYRTSGHGFTGTELSDRAGEALSLAALAGVVVTLLLGLWGRRLVGALVTLLGLGVVLVAALRRTPTAAQVEQALGVRDTPGIPTAWPWLCLVAGAGTAVVGLLFVLRAHRWRNPSDRFARTPAASPSAVNSSLDAWKALDAGADPTAFDGNLTPEAPTGRRDQAGPASGTPSQQEQS